MNFGQTVYHLRKKKNVTQEDLAAELGVTAAAVSKWEKGYSLPDLLMLCALADYFHVTTDELLGRATAMKQAIIVAQNDALGLKIAELTANYHIQCKAILTDYSAALEARQLAAESGSRIHYMFTALDHPLDEQEMDDSGDTIQVNVHAAGGTDEDILNGIELYLRNEDAFKNIRDLTANCKK